MNSAKTSLDELLAELGEELTQEEQDEVRGGPLVVPDLGISGMAA